MLTDDMPHTSAAARNAMFGDLLMVALLQSHSLELKSPGDHAARLSASAHLIPEWL
jgi:hypothetical protein